MNIQKSLFQFEDFLILRFSCAFIDPGDQKEIKIRSLTDKYSVNLDFNFVEKKSDKIFLLYCKASINNGEQRLPGYQIFVEGAGVFYADLGSGLPIDRYQQEIQLPAISQGINQLRNYIMNATGQFPFGKYQFPLIDLEHLVKAKAAEFRLRHKPSEEKEPNT